MKMGKKKTKVTKKTFVFIDGENVRNALEESGYKDLDYLKIFEWLKKKKNVSRLYLYVGVETGDTAKEKELKKLSRDGIIVQPKKVNVYKTRPYRKSVVCPKCKHKHAVYIKRADRKKANCDAEMTLDIMNQGVRGRYGRIIVFSGDGDFTGVYDYVTKQLKKNVCVYSPSGRRTSHKIKTMFKSKQIHWEDLGTLYQHFAIK